MRFRCRLAAAVAWCGLSVLFSTVGLAAPPQKAETARKAFDYRRPDPGEMQANPPVGLGTSPRLLEYSPTASMTEGSAGATAPSTLTATSGTSESLAGNEPTAAAAQPAPAPVKPASVPATPLAPAPTPVAPPPDLQALLAAAVTTSGIDSVAAVLPAAGVPADPALRLSAEQAWVGLAGSLAASAVIWTRRYPDRTPAALDRVETRSEPGRLTIVTAPGRLTGAFDNSSP